MVNIGVLGSCVSRDAFNSKFNEDYSDFFNIKISSGRNSLISLMSEPVDIDEKKLFIKPDTKENFFRTNCLKLDFNKGILEDIIKSDIEYLILDNYFEVIFGVLYWDDSIVTNNVWDLYETEFYSSLNKRNILQIFNNGTEYFNMWSVACDKFFKFMFAHRPDIKIILNPVMLSVDAFKKNGALDKNRYLEEAKLYNPYLIQLNKYIVENFDVYLMNYNKDLISDDNHPWGPGAVHFTKSFYNYFLENLKFIVRYDYFFKNNLDPFSNENFNENFLIELHDEFQKYMKEDFILKNKLNQHILSLSSHDSIVMRESIDFNENSHNKHCGKVILENYIFSRPNNFILQDLFESNVIKLVNLSENITLFITVYGRFGNHCENEFNIHLEKNEHNLVSHNKILEKDILFYNLVVFNGGIFESIYFFSKYNKTFRLSFKLNEELFDTLEIVKEIYSSIQIN